MCVKNSEFFRVASPSGFLDVLAQLSVCLSHGGGGSRAGRGHAAASFTPSLLSCS